jgi:uncharacterized membrane protein YgcG
MIASALTPLEAKLEKLEVLLSGLAEEAAEAAGGASGGGGHHHGGGHHGGGGGRPGPAGAWRGGGA